MAYGVVRTDKLMGTDVRSMLESVKYMGAGSTATAIDNGEVTVRHLFILEYLRLLPYPQQALTVLTEVQIIKSFFALVAFGVHITDELRRLASLP